MKDTMQMLLNLADTIAKLNGAKIMRLSINRLFHNFDAYAAEVEYSDGTRYTLRSDATIVELDGKGA